MEIYRYDNYRELIEGLMRDKGKQGSRSRVAQAAGCSPSWITRSLNGAVHITADQALGIATYFQLNEIETDYFLSLVEFERAGTVLLKKRIRKKLESLRIQGLGIGSSVRTGIPMNEEESFRYYGSWLYSALHVACTIQPFSGEELAERFKCSAETIAQILSGLRGMGLLTSQSGRWRATSKSVHLSNQHPMANVAHANWRSRTVQKLQEQGQDGLHYSAIHSLSRKDVQLIQERLKESVLACRKTIEASEAETIAVFCVDWYTL